MIYIIHASQNRQRRSLNMKISEKTIEEIADQLDCGMKCYLKKATGTLIIPIPDEDLNNSISTDSHSEIKETYENPVSYIAFEEMSSRESFNVMMDFTDEICEEPLKAALIAALRSKNPFRNFKSKIDDSESCRQKWFAYKRNKYLEFVKMQIPDNLFK